MTDVRRGVAADASAVTGMLAAAFADDPLFVWWFADPATRPQRLLAVMGRLLDVRLEGGEVWVGDGGACAALWNQPGGLTLDAQAAEDGWRELFSAFSLDERSRGKAFEAVAEKWHPTAPHWYLGVLGTDPARQGKGLGTAVMRPVLERCDAEGLPAYLETMTPANVPFYQRRGFVVLGEDTVPGGPPTWFMWREPQPPGQTS